MPKRPIQGVFVAECAAIRPLNAAKAQQFGISRIQLYADDGTGQWGDLTSAASLQPYAQLYVFQSDPNFKESQDQIPPARRPACYSVSPDRSNNRGTSAIGTPMEAARTGSSKAESRYDALTPTPTVVTPSGTGINNSRHGTPSKAAAQIPYVPYGQQGASSFPTNGGASANAKSTRAPATYTVGVSSSHKGTSAPQNGHNHQPQRSESLGGNTVVSGVSTSSPYFPASMNTTQAEKAHIIFEAASKNPTRQTLQEGDLRALFRDTNIDFAPYVIAALFRQADTNRDGSIDFTDLQQMLKEYPTLTDALYFRLRDLHEGELLQQRLADECVRLEENKLKRDHAKAAEEENNRRMAEHIAKMKHLEGEWQRRLAMEHDINDRFNAARNEAIAHQQKATHHHKDLAVLVGREDAARRSLTQAERETQYSEQQYSKALQQTQLAAHRVKELEGLLEAAKAELAQQERNTAECLIEVQRSKDNEQKAAEQLSEMNGDLQRRKEFNETVSDDTVAHSAKVADLQKILNECQIENEKLAQTIELSSEDLRRFEHSRDACRKDIAMAEASVNESDRRIAAADQAIVIFAQRRASTEAKEKPLLEQEIRLKEQRLQLDENEVLLRREAYTVFDPLARAGGY